MFSVGFVRFDRSDHILDHEETLNNDNDTTAPASASQPSLSDDDVEDSVNSNVNNSETDSVMDSSIACSSDTLTSTHSPDGFDIGKLLKAKLTDCEVRLAILSGPTCHPKIFPCDSKNVKFPVSLLTSMLQNGDSVKCDWLVWSKEMQALFVESLVVIKI